VKLHLGCGKRYFEGWTHIDVQPGEHIDHVHDITTLPMIGDGAADIVYASHVLEYFDLVEVDRVLQEWRRVLRVGGTLRVAVPNFPKLEEVYRKTGDLTKILGPLYGRIEVDEGRFLYHKTVYDFALLTDVLTKNGFGAIRTYRWQDTEPHASVDDHSQAYFSAHG
jgi:predicted SAM-dependent methyltransferase